MGRVHQRRPALDLATRQSGGLIRTASFWRAIGRTVRAAHRLSPFRARPFGRFISAFREAPFTLATDLLDPRRPPTATVWSRCRKLFGPRETGTGRTSVSPE